MDFVSGVSWLYDLTVKSKGGSKMYSEIETAFASDQDITFILECIYNDSGEPLSLECVGWHFGEPTEDSKHYKGNLKAIFDL